VLTQSGQPDRVGQQCFELVPVGPFSLEASTRFLERFAPAAYRQGTGRHLHLAFAVEESWATVGVCVRQDGERVIGEVVGDPAGGAVADQVARILSLDIDGRGFGRVGEADPVVGRLQSRYPGLRPVLFWSPYEAAAWALIGHRVRITQAAAVKARMAEELGETVVVHGEVLHAFPAPDRLADLEAFPGLFARKAEYLRGLAQATLAGNLDAAQLRASPADDALAALRCLPGIGAFSADLVLVRGAGHPDHFPVHERRLAHAMARAYGLGHDPSADDLSAIAEHWRPYRSWVALLLRTQLEDGTHEITRQQRRSQ
jgi:DNA-3-methyladenine glycosylase II